MNQFKHISCEQTAALVSTNKQATVIDIRDSQSYQTGHMDCATLINNENVQDFIREADMDEPLVIVCYHGNSSQQAAQFFIDQDFTDVYSMDGGFDAWQRQYPSEITSN